MKCTICFGSALFAFKSKYVEVAQCGTCGHLFAMFRTARSGVQSPVNLDSAEGFRDRNVRLIRRLLRDGVLRRGGSVLDIGSGVGHIASALRETGFEVYCVEANADSLAALKARGFAASAIIDDIQGTFDTITMIEVIEHLDDPVTELIKLRPLLKSGGSLFITTPCGEARFGNRRTSAYDTREHVQFFTERSLDLAVTMAGFSRFQFVVMKEMYPKSSLVKNILRPLRAMILGHYHLVGYAHGDSKADSNHPAPAYSASSSH